MMKYIFALLLSSFSIYTFAQIKGRIVDNNQQELPGAAVALLKDNSIFLGTTTDTEGRFSINAPAGSYTLEVSFISYQKEIISIELKSTQENLNLGTIALKEASSALDEVEVVGQAQMMEFSQDKRIYNVAKDLSNVGSNASDILNNIPSVAVDVEGNINLRGSENVRILIDGKPSGLIGSDPSNALRQLQSSMIEKIEVITNPSARYDAEGEAGIINIVLKKNQKSGINGNFELTTGYPDRHGVTAGINYRTGKFNFFTNASLNYRRSPGGGIVEQSFSTGDTAYTTNQDQERYRGGTSGAFRFGVDYSLTPTQTITATFLYRPSLGDNFSGITYNDFDPNDIALKTSLREDFEREVSRTLEGDIHYEKRFKNKDHKLSMDIKFQDDDDSEKSNIEESITNIILGNDSVLKQKVSNIENEQNFLFQADYTHPFKNKNSFELGTKASLRDIVNNSKVETQNENGDYIIDSLFTNDFNYLENIYAAYAIYNGELKKLSYQFGLRSEYSDITIKLQDQEVKKNYINFFPSAFFTWDINTLSDIQLNYSRRLSRPRFRSLLPFSSYSDSRNVFGGNPDLNPEYTDSYEMAYVRYFEKATLYSGIYYRHRTGVTQRVLFVNDDQTTFRRPINLAVQDAYGFEFTLTYDILKWWSINGNLNLYQANTVGSYEGIDYGNENFSSQGRIMSKFSFLNSDLQASFNYRGPSVQAQGKNLAMYSMDLGWSKDVLKGNGTITAAITDVFNSRKWRNYTYTYNDDGSLQTERYQEFQWRQRQFQLTFSYRLNQRKARTKPEKNYDGGDDFGM